MNRLPVVEIFGPTLQGEGVYAGKLVSFVRLAGCDSKCKWCDTKEAWDIKAGKLLSVADIYSEIKKTGTNTVVITGGNPVIHNLRELVALLRCDDIQVHVETQGSIYADWLDDVDHITVSPKGPSSGVDSPLIDLTVTNILASGWASKALKFVINGEEDLTWSLDLIASLKPLIVQKQIPIILQPCTVKGQEAALPQICVHIFETIRDMKRYTEIQDLDVRVLPQMHVLFWGHKKGV